MNAGGQMLVAAPGRWDDACFVIPAVRALVDSGLWVGVLCEERQKAVWETIKGVAVIGISEKANAKTVAGEISERWNAAMIWEPGTAADACLRAKIPKRIGPEGKELKKYLTHPVDLSKSPGPVEHRVQFYLTLLAKLGIPTKQAAFFEPAWEPKAEPGTILLAPDSDFGKTYEWLFDLWVELAKSLKESELKISVAGISGHRDLGRMLASAVEGAEFHAIERLAEALPMLAAHELVVTAESSLPHLAAHAGTTCVTLFGPGDPAFRRPLGRRHGVARRHVECAPCFLPKCPMDLRCQNDLTVERVLQSVLATRPQPAINAV